MFRFVEEEDTSCVDNYDPPSSLSENTAASESKQELSGFSRGFVLSVVAATRVLLTRRDGASQTRDAKRSEHDRGQTFLCLICLITDSSLSLSSGV